MAHRNGVSRFLLIMCATSCVLSACVPIVPGCVCKTTSNFTCTDVNNIRAALKAKFASLLPADPAVIHTNPLFYTYAVGRLKGGIVRLAFHDAGEYNRSAPDLFADGTPRYRSDGCVDTSNPQSAGLETTIAYLDTVWADYCTKISRADFWFLAAKITVEESTPYVVSTGAPLDPLAAGANVTNFTIPFFIGREDRANCTVAETNEPLPSAEGGAAEIRRTLMDNLLFDAEHATALMGAHTLGGASASGYQGVWKVRPDLFTTQFFANIINQPWKRIAITTSTGATLQQWNSTPPAQETIMFNTDMALVFDVIGNLNTAQEDALPPVCNFKTPPHAANGLPAGHPPVPAGANPASCPFTNVDFPTLNFQEYVTTYAQGWNTTGDLPGSIPFLSAFSRAFTYMASVGYASGTLQCMPCASTNVCPLCTQNNTDLLCGVNNQYVPAAAAGSNVPAGVVSTVAPTAHPTTAQPHPTTSQPHPTTAQPHPTTSQSHPTTVQPHPTTSQSHPTTVQLHPTTAQPHPTTVQPHPTTAQPHPTTSQPHPTTAEPHPTTAQPHPTTAQPHPTTEIPRPPQPQGQPPGNPAGPSGPRPPMLPNSVADSVTSGAASAGAVFLCSLFALLVAIVA